MSVNDFVSLATSSAYYIEDYSFDEFAEPASLTWPTSSGRQAPPNTPSSEYSRSPQRSRQSHVDLSLVHVIDFRAISYDGLVDENLICAICRCVLVEPISTTCQHTFCTECLENALSNSPTCPIDRSALDKEIDLIKVPKIIQNQLDSLKVICPCCQTPVSRLMIGNHMSKYCPESLTRCPGINTEKKCSSRIPRKLVEQGCLHYSTCCPDCQETVQQIDLLRHREALCKARHVECGNCGNTILRLQEREHAEECLEATVPCRWKEYGCGQETWRKDLSQHLESCSFQLIGRVAETFKKDINELRTKVQTLTETNQLQERRIKFLEYGSRQFDRSMDFDNDPSSPNISSVPAPANMDPLNSEHEYLLSLLEFQENKISQLSAGMSELEAKQISMLFNETIPIKNELAEIRSLQQTANMHIRWLMAFRLRENSKRAGNEAVPDSNEESIPGSSGDTPCLRRSIDFNSRDIVTKL